MRKLALPMLLTLLILPLARAPAQEPSAAAAGGFTEDEQKTLTKALKLDDELIRLVAKVRPCSVTIENWRGKPPRMVSGGSGVIVSTKGYILTNQHVALGAEEIWVVLEDHRRCKAKVVGADKLGDICLLKIDARGLKHANVNKANPDRLSAGEWVFATGNGFFMGRDGEAVVSFGVVSGLGRVAPGQFFYGDAIQHDARINPGNSGGPLWDTYGNLLGINGKISSTGMGGFRGPSSEGVSYTIPIDQIRNFLEPMMEGKTAKHGHEILGLKLRTFTNSDGEQAGAEVLEVSPDSPASPARSKRPVQVGDVIWKITPKGRRSKWIRNVTDYLNEMSPKPEGSEVALHIHRGYKKLVIPVELDPPRRNKKRGR